METQRNGFATWREASGLTCTEIANRLGITPGAVSHWETGRFSPSATAVRLLAREYGLRVEVVESWFREGQA